MIEVQLKTPDTKNRKIEEEESYSSATSSSMTSGLSDSMAGNSGIREDIKMPKDDASMGEWGKFLYSCIQSTKEEMTTKIDEMKDDKAATVSVLSTIKKSVECLITENAALKHENVDLKERLIKLEYHSRRNNLLLDGIPESKGETETDCYNKVISSFEKLFENDVDDDGKITKSCTDKAKDMIINRIHRYGKFNVGRTRAIIMNFQWYGDRSFVLRERKNLGDGVFVNEDFPFEIQERRNVLRPILKQALQIAAYRGKVSLRYDKLVINSKEYTLQNLNELPADLNPAKTCERSDNGIIGFLGVHTPLSNFYPCKFVMENTSYNCAEQRIQSKKAEMFDDDLTHYQIMRSKNPMDMKRLGNNIKNYIPQKWEQEMYKIAYHAVLCKFTQNENLMSHLVDTRENFIIEASRDETWGCGLSLRHPGLLHKEQWKNAGGMMSSVYTAVKQELGIIK